MSRLICISFLFFVNYTTARLYSISDNSLTTAVVIQSAVDIANREFNYRIQTIIVSKDVELSLVNRFIMSYKGTVMVEINGDELPTKQIAVLVQSFASFIKILDKLKPDLKGRALLHSRVKLLVVMFSYPHKLRNINRILWNYYTTNVVFVIADRRNEIVFYTYYPYKNHLNCQNMEPIQIGFWNNRIVLKRELYEDKMKNLQGCPLYITTDKLFHPVTDQKIALQIIKQTIVRSLRSVMNFTPIVYNKDFISIGSDRTTNWSISLKELADGTANISTCTVTLGVEGNEILDFSAPYFRVRLGWLAPPPRTGPTWRRLYSPLNGYLWLVLLLVILFVKSLPLIMKIEKINKFCHRHFKNFDKLQNVALRSWGVMMGQPIHISPRRFRDFYIILIWIWFTFIVRSAYQSVLIGALKSNITDGKFATIAEAIDLGYSYGGTEGILVFFQQNPSAKENFVIIPDAQYSDVFRDVLNGRKKFILVMFLEYAWAYCLAQGWTEDECGHVIPDSVTTVPVVVWMKKDSAFKRSVNTWVVRFLESGLLDKYAMKKPLMNTLKASDPSPLTINQMSSCMLCLIIGYLISIVILLVEIITFNSKSLCKIKKHIFIK